MINETGQFLQSKIHNVIIEYVLKSHRLPNQAR